MEDDHKEDQARALKDLEDRVRIYLLKPNIITEYNIVYDQVCLSDISNSEPPCDR